MSMRNHIQWRSAGRVTSKSFIWLLILSALQCLVAGRVSNPQVLTNPASSGSRTVENRAGAGGQCTIGANVSRVLSVRRPIAFEPNRGQINQRFKFLGRGERYNLFIGDREAVLTLDSGSAAPGLGSRQAQRRPQAGEASREHKVIAISLLGARADSRIEAHDQLPGRINYLIGNDSRRWHTGIPIYGRVLERGVWPGVDLAYYGNQRQIECDFLVAPLANPDVIELGLVNAGALSIDADGNQLVITGGQKLRLLRPMVYQGQGAARREIGGQYVLRGKSRVAFQVAAYDHERPLVIDPAVTLAYSTYLGGSGYKISGYGDAGSVIAVDSGGSAYITGSTSSVNFPTKRPFQGSNKGYPNGFNTFVTKFSADGRSLVYSTYLGGSGFDDASRLAWHLKSLQAVRPISGDRWVSDLLRLPPTHSFVRAGSRKRIGTQRTTFPT